MADRFPAQILIGGQVSRTKRLYPDDPDDDTTILQGLVSALNDDGASPEYGDVAIDDKCTEKELEKYIDCGWLRLRQDQAVLGEFPETEQFCIDNGISYDRNSDHYCEYDAELLYWRPGMMEPTIRYADARGDEVVAGATVRKAMALLDGISKLSVLNVDAVTTVLEKVARLLHDACPKLPPDLAPFEII